jgi:hypothetical protein
MVSAKLGGFEVDIAHKVPDFRVGLDDLIDQVSCRLAFNDGILKFLRQRGPLLLLGVVFAVCIFLSRQRC